MGVSGAVGWRTTPGGRVDSEKVIYGIAAHGVYHTGQIRLLKAMGASEQE